jgi:hypothetical protein
LKIEKRNIFEDSSRIIKLTIEEAMKRTKGKMELCSIRKERKKFKRKIIFKRH